MFLLSMLRAFMESEMTVVAETKKVDIPGTSPKFAELAEIMGLKLTTGPMCAFAIIEPAFAKRPHDDGTLDQVTLHLANGDTAAMCVDRFSGTPPQSFDHLRQREGPKIGSYTQVGPSLSERAGLSATHSASSFDARDYPVDHSPPAQLIQTLQERAQRVRDFVRSVHPS